MAKAKITRKFDEGEDTRVFENAKPFEHLKTGDIVILKLAGNVKEEYVVTEREWDFSSFGDKFNVLEITVVPRSKKPALPLAPVVQPPDKEDTGIDSDAFERAFKEIFDGGDGLEDEP